MIRHQQGLPRWWNYDEDGQRRKSVSIFVRRGERWWTAVRSSLALIAMLMGSADMVFARDDRAVERQQMVAEIVALAGLTAVETGRPSLDARVLDAMRKVPRHELYRRCKGGPPIATGRCRSAAGRRFRNPTSSP
jgi:hypothetical protein